MKSGIRIGIMTVVLISLLSILSCQSIVGSFAGDQRDGVTKANLLPSPPTQKVS